MHIKGDRARERKFTEPIVHTSWPKHAIQTAYAFIYRRYSNPGLLRCSGHLVGSKSSSVFRFLGGGSVLLSVIISFKYRYILL